tara:strand:+ start:6651 stop:6848 length:198 start_codon:yes stop_codon:yes gene_type:complete
MGCNCGKNKKFPPKKSSRMPIKKNNIEESRMCPNERRAKIIKLQNAKKLKQIRREQFEWERRSKQ